MNQHALIIWLRVVSGIIICVNVWSLWQLATGHAWNCPQPTLVSVRSGLINIAGIFVGVSMPLIAKNPKLAGVFAIPAILFALVGITLFLQVDSASCSIP